jgi:hypothetical protein
MDKNLNEEALAILDSRKSEHAERAAEIFHEMLEILQHERQVDWKVFARMAEWLSEDFWPNVYGLGDLNHNLFAEFELGAIKWIWNEPDWQSEAIYFLKKDIHFGCFVLTEGVTHSEFTRQYIELALAANNYCEVCSQIGEGWIAPLSYIVEDENTETKDLQKIYEHYKENFGQNLNESFELMYSFASNPKTPIAILEQLSLVNEKSLGHAIRFEQMDLRDDEIEMQSNISWRAKSTLSTL